MPAPMRPKVQVAGSGTAVVSDISEVYSLPALFLFPSVNNARSGALDTSEAGSVTPVICSVNSHSYVGPFGPGVDVGYFVYAVVAPQKKSVSPGFDWHPMFALLRFTSTL